MPWAGANSEGGVVCARAERGIAGAEKECGNETVCVGEARPLQDVNGEKTIERLNELRSVSHRL